MSKVICIVGPTASGKTGLAIELAKKIDAEVISADSMQIYKDLDVGTAKVTEEEAQGIPHHMINVCNVEDKFSVADFKSMFKDMITELSTTEKTERQTKEHRFLATLACKAAVKGGMKLDVEEQKRLVDNMIVLDNPFTCPHGRPTAVPMTRYEIERKFMRK